MIRVVMDTNVLVSGILKQHGAEAAVLDFLAAERVIWCVSPNILEEYRRVLRRPKFDFDDTTVNRYLELARAAVLVEPAFTRRVSPHEPDNRFLECVEAAAADYLITGNTRHFPTRWKTTLIVNARQFLELL